MQNDKIHRHNISNMHVQEFEMKIPVLSLENQIQYTVLPLHLGGYGFWHIKFHCKLVLNATNDVENYMERNR